MQLWDKPRARIAQSLCIRMWYRDVGGNSERRRLQDIEQCCQMRSQERKQG